MGLSTIKSLLVFASYGLFYGSSSTSEIDIKSDYQELENKTSKFRESIEADPILADLFRKEGDKKEKYGLLDMKDLKNISLQNLDSMLFATYDKTRNEVIAKSVSGKEEVFGLEKKAIYIPIVCWIGGIPKNLILDCEYCLGEFDFKDLPNAKLRINCKVNGKLNFKNLSRNSQINFVSLFIGDKISLEGYTSMGYRIFGLNEYSHSQDNLFQGNLSLLEKKWFKFLINCPRYNIGVLKGVNYYKTFKGLNCDTTYFFEVSLNIGYFSRCYKEDTKRIIDDELGMYDQQDEHGRVTGTMIVQHDSKKISAPEIYANDVQASEKCDPFQNQLILKNFQRFFDEHIDLIFPCRSEAEQIDGAVVKTAMIEDNFQSNGVIQGQKINEQVRETLSRSTFDCGLPREDQLNLRRY